MHYRKYSRSDIHTRNRSSARECSLSIAIMGMLKDSEGSHCKFVDDGTLRHGGKELKTQCIS